MNGILSKNPVSSLTKQGDADRIIDTFVAAFRCDPAARWLFPDEHAFDDQFGRFARAFTGPALKSQTAHFTDGFLGAAAWFAPGVQGEDEPVMEVIEQCIPSTRHPEVFGVFEQMDYFHPDFEHWYLPLIGVAPGQQGNGIGTLLLKHVLDDCDRSGAPAYLESSNAANLPLYRRQGFQVLGEIQSGSSPVIYPMLRQPQSI